MTLDAKFLTLGYWLDRDDTVRKATDDLKFLVHLKICTACGVILKTCNCATKTEGLSLVFENDNPQIENIQAIQDAANKVVAAAPVAAPASAVTFLDRALPMAKLGIPCILLRERTKVAVQPEWQNVATTDAATLRNWAASYPDATVGQSVPSAPKRAEVDIIATYATAVFHNALHLDCVRKRPRNRVGRGRGVGLDLDLV